MDSATNALECIVQVYNFVDFSFFFLLFPGKASGDDNGARYM